MTDRPQDLKPHVYGNFKVKDYSKHENSKNYEKRPGMSEAHLDLIRKMPCAATLAMPGGEAHHLKCVGNRGMGLRTEDRWAVPLAHIPHMEVEAAGSKNELQWFRDHGIADVRELAERLWESTGDLPRMIKILIAHRNSSS